MRLIDADKLKEAINSSLNTGRESFSPEIIYEAIDVQPTAFDVDKAVEQLEKLIEDKTSESGDDWWTAQCLNEAVDIVKGGGVDDN